MIVITVSVLLLWSAIAQGMDVVGRTDCAKVDAAEFFFPKGVLGEQLSKFDADAFTREWYSTHLRTMAEPSLSCGQSDDESYRFLWLRTWGHPITVRVEAGQPHTLTAVELDGAGGYEPGKVVRRVTRQLSAEEWRTLSHSSKALNFWKMPTRLPHHGSDGAQWVLEGRSGREYHVVDRWSPRDGAYRDFCLMLVKFAGLMPSGESRRDTVY
jgi:hypothetical protein